jgi:hypothetical protein
MGPRGAVLLSAAAALVTVSTAAGADQGSPPAVRTGPATPAARAPDEVDVSKVKPDLVVLHDGNGHYLALLAMREMDLTFYGDGRTFHQLRIRGSSRDTAAGRSSRRFWSPISTDADIILGPGGKWTVQCSDRTTPMVPLAAGDTREMLGRARFMKPFWKRQALVLARDDRGSYYYVDKIRDDRSAHERERDPNPPRGYRLYIGRKGRMAEQRLSDAVEDSKGMVLSMKKADLTIDFDSSTATYSSGKRKDKLVFLPVEDNTMLIYRDLGLYQKLGVPCDDM